MQPGVNNPRLKMNPKTKRKPAANKTASDSPVAHQRLVIGQSCKDLHRFVNEIIRYGEEPSSWPLTQQEQIAFVRTVIYQARKIRNTEEYLADEIKIAAENLAMAS